MSRDHVFCKSPVLPDSPIASSAVPTFDTGLNEAQSNRIDRFPAGSRCGDRLLSSGRKDSSEQTSIAMPENVDVVIVGPHFDERVLRPVPLLDDLVDHVFAPIQLEADRALVRLRT